MFYCAWFEADAGAGFNGSQFAVHPVDLGLGCGSIILVINSIDSLNFFLTESGIGIEGVVDDGVSLGVFVPSEE